MIELHKIMRQKDDQTSTELLNRIRITKQTEDDITVIQSRSISPNDSSYATDSLHIWTENAPVDEYNKKKLDELPGSLFVLKPKNQYPTNVKKTKH